MVIKKPEKNKNKKQIRCENELLLEGKKSITNGNRITNSKDSYLVKRAKEENIPQKNQLIILDGSFTDNIAINAKPEKNK